METKSLILLARISLLSMLVALLGYGIQTGNVHFFVMTGIGLCLSLSFEYLVLQMRKKDA